MPKHIAQGAGYVHVTDQETGEVTVLEPGQEVPEELEGKVGDHLFEENGFSDAEVDLVAGPSQGISDIDRDALEKARKAEASRRSRQARRAQSGTGAEKTQDGS